MTHQQVAKGLCTLNHHQKVLHGVVCRLNKNQLTEGSVYYTADYFIVSLCYCQIQIDAYYDYNVRDEWPVFIGGEVEH